MSQERTQRAKSPGEPKGRVLGEVQKKAVVAIVALLVILHFGIFNRMESWDVDTIWPLFVSVVPIGLILCSRKSSALAEAEPASYGFVHSRYSSRFAIFTCITGVAIGCWLFFYHFVPAAARWQTAIEWRNATCRIDETTIGDVMYSFEFDGHRYSSHQVDFGGRLTMYDRANLEKYVEEPCWFDPDNPEESVLFRSLGLAHWLCGVGGSLMIIMFALGAWSVISVHLSRNRESHLLLLATTTSLPLYPENSSWGALVAKGGEGLLRPGIIADAPLTKTAWAEFAWETVGTSIATTVAWYVCTAMSITVGLDAPAWLSVLLSATVIAAVGYQFQSMLRNATAMLLLPIPRVAIGHERCYPGAVVRMSWALHGWLQPTRLRLYLVGREWATHSMGSEVVTDTAIFHQAELLAFNELPIPEQGQLRVPIPAGMMHSFSSHDNKITWSIVFDVDHPFVSRKQYSFGLGVSPSLEGAKQ